ncbi:MAG TPA: ACT domain-containing protein, partial [Roseococcus sp.]|nr:ACT domain-containing protein [Roseococcus sp.]
QDATGAPYGADDPRALAALAVRLAAVAAGREAAPALGGGRRRQARSGPAGAVTFDTASSEDALIVEVSARDRPGLLADLARAVTDAGLTLLSAHVGSYGDRAVDAFYVTDAAGAKPSEPDQLKALCGALLEAVAEPGPAPVRPEVPASLP